MYKIGIILCIFVGLTLANITDNEVEEDDVDSYPDYGNDSDENPLLGTTCELTHIPPTPDSKCCGIDVSAAPKIKGGSPTLLDQYPWLALIEYENSFGITWSGCGGSLISGLYVLTAAHCASIPNAEPRNVILGDYNNTHKGPDCIQDKYGKELCSEGEVRISIAQFIPHQFYMEGVDSLSDTAWSHSDIALIRLKEKAPFTDSIRPICLPTFDITNLDDKYAYEKLSLAAAGWGVYMDIKMKENYLRIPSHVKRHVRLPYVPVKTCKRRWNHVTGYQVCAGGEKGKDTCKGDSGGPLMFNKAGQYELTGVTSYGENNPCADGSPGVYANVYRYKRWIMDVIKYGGTE